MAKSGNSKKKPKRRKQEIVQAKLDAAAKVLNHPALRPGLERNLIAGNGAGPAQPFDEKLTLVTVYQAFCNSNDENIGSSTTNYGEAKAAALHHHQATGHSTTVLQSN